MLASLRNALPVDLLTNEEASRNLPANRIAVAAVGALLWVEPPFVIFMRPELWNRVKHDFLQRYPHVGVHEVTRLHLAVGVRRA
jgi:hypothetical protein